MLSTHASKSYAMSPHGTPSLWEGWGGPPVRMALPPFGRAGVGFLSAWYSPPIVGEVWSVARGGVSNYTLHPLRFSVESFHSV